MERNSANQKPPLSFEDYCQKIEEILKLFNRVPVVKEIRITVGFKL